TVGRRARAVYLRGSGDPRFELDLVPVGIAQIEGGPVAVGPVALDDAPLQLGALFPELAGRRLQIVAVDRETEVVEPSWRCILAGRQEVDEVVAEAELDERYLLVHAIEGAAEDLFVEAPGARLVAHPEHDVVEPERLERHAPQCSARTGSAGRASTRWASSRAGARRGSPSPPSTRSSHRR